MEHLTDKEIKAAVFEKPNYTELLEAYKENRGLFIGDENFHQDYLIKNSSGELYNIYRIHTPTGMSDFMYTDFIPFERLCKNMVNFDFNGIKSKLKELSVEK